MIFWAFVMLSIFCENGERVTNQFQVFNVELRQFNWYILPINVQKMFVIMVANAQQPSFIRGFANALCLRESFKVVKYYIDWNEFLFICSKRKC